MTNEREMAVFGRNFARKAWEDSEDLDRNPSQGVRVTSLLAALVQDSEKTRDYSVLIYDTLRRIERLLEQQPKRKAKRARGKK